VPNSRTLPRAQALSKSIGRHFALVVIAFAVVMTALFTVDHVEPTAASSGHSSVETVDRAIDAGRGCVGGDRVVASFPFAAPVAPVVPDAKAQLFSGWDRRIDPGCTTWAQFERTAWMRADEPDRTALEIHRA
jgi:hypothetical protein